MDSFTLREGAHGNHSIGGWVGHRAGLDGVEKRKFLALQGLEPRPLGRPARSQEYYINLRSVTSATVPSDKVALNNSINYQISD
jgi:hypothetical protein